MYLYPSEKLVALCKTFGFEESLVNFRLSYHENICIALCTLELRDLQSQDLDWTGLDMTRRAVFSPVVQSYHTVRMVPSVWSGSTGRHA